MSRRAHPEQDLVHKPLWAWATCHRIGGTEAQPVHLSDHLIHVPSGIPSGGWKAARAGGIRKGMGAPDGFPDFFLPLPSMPLPRSTPYLWHGAALELKAPGSTLHDVSSAQRAWLQRLYKAGYAASWTDSAEAGKWFFRCYLAGTLVLDDPLRKWTVPSHGRLQAEAPPQQQT